jgi:methylenetetrahydrofolate reductase (NADPH)
MTGLVSSVGFEVIPMKGVEEKVALLPAGAKVSVIASPTKGMASTLDLSSRLHSQGFRVTPHLSARLVADRQELDSIIDSLGTVGIDRVLVVGGDAIEPGKFGDALELLREMDARGHHFTEVGIAGHPEGHPFIPPAALRQALIDKQRYAHYITTQMCFDPSAIGSWLGDIRRWGIELPVRAGIPGVVDPIRLGRIAARIGVGASMRYLMRNRNAVLRLLRPGAFRPTKLVTALDRLDPGLGLEGLHIFTFNQIEPTLRWLAEMARR